MRIEEVEEFCRNLGGELIETHISWVILTNELAYKIKKPVKFSFLDFSSIEKRQHYCKEEVRLNSRLTDIYLGTAAIVKSGNGVNLNKNAEGEIIDYTVVMRRMPSEKRLDLMLNSNLVTQEKIVDLAGLLADFHRSAEIVEVYDNIRFIESRYKDVLQVSDWVKENLGPSAYGILEDSVEFHEKYIREQSDIFIKRVDGRFKRDLHGDLHTQNVFLNSKAVVFDCIEFNPLYRQIDVLNELAFLCMDMESKGKAEFSEVFLNSYLQIFPVIKNEEDVRLLNYYKCYRANVKIKVTGLRAMQDSISRNSGYVEAVKNYIRILEKYLN